jgi:hypothetical protein
MPQFFTYKCASASGAAAAAITARPCKTQAVVALAKDNATVELFQDQVRDWRGIGWMESLLSPCCSRAAGGRWRETPARHAARASPLVQ